MQCKDWEETYLKFSWLVVNPKKLSRVLKEWNLDRDAKILDLCCGSGGCFPVFRKENYNNLFGLDLSSNLLSRADSGVPLIQGDAFHCPIKDNTFDVVFINKALHHFLDHTALLKEVKRILKPQGYLCFIEPRSTWFRNIYHAVFFFPLIDIVPPLKEFKRASLVEEAGTYFPWLSNTPNFFRKLEGKHGFSIELKKKDLSHYVIKCKNNK
jgi:ubiquinone/menaquinone biosynthesis C-methylase UbiE